MSLSDDYQDVRALSELSDRELDALFDGRDPVDGEGLEDLARHLQEARAVLVTPPAPETSRRHLALIAEVARPVTPAFELAEPREGLIHIARKVALRLGLGSLSAFLSIGGLAYAGVELPGTAAERAFEAVTGVELPNQDSAPAAEEADEKHSSENHGSEVSAAASDHTVEKGCEFGHAIAALAAEKSFEVRQDEGDHAAPCAAASEHAQGSRATGEEHSAEGADHAAEGKAHAEEAKAHGAETATEHQEAAAEKSNQRRGSRATGEATSSEHAQESASHPADAETLSGGHAHVNVDLDPTDLP